MFHGRSASESIHRSRVRRGCELRDKLPAVLSAPLSELFTEDALAAQYTQRKNSGAAA